MSSNFDAVIVGSGLGGLTCGAFLAKAGQRVLVLESHSKIGGYAHSFKRKQYRFESGIHSVAMAPNGLVMHLLRLLDLDRTLQTIPHPSMFGVHTPTLDFSVPAEAADIREAFARRFPAERDSLQRLFADMARFYERMMRPTYNYEDRMDPEDAVFISQYYNRSYKDYIDGFITDPALRGIFYAQWPFAGSSPDYAPVIFDVLLFHVHLTEGSHFLKGGFSTLADALAGVIARAGGEVRTRSRVTRLVAEQGAVRFALLETGEEFGAPLFISNVSPYLLHSTLLDEPARNKVWIRRLARLNPSLSAVVVYLGLKPGAHDGIPDNIMMAYASDDHARIFDDIWNNRAVEPQHLILLKTPGAHEENAAMLLTFVRASLHASWKAGKEAFGRKMLDYAGRLYPELPSAIEFVEMGSPSTFDRYTGNTDGALYGFENTRVLYGEAKLPLRTHIANLYQAGHWGKPGGGVWNVMQNGYAAAKTILHSAG